MNNAGILRDRTVANMSIEEWDDVIRVHLRGTFCMLRHCAAHWRDLAKAGEQIDARVVNTTSGSGIYGNPGQSNYGAAKAAIASLTIIAAQELARYGVRVNAIAPTGLTRMTEDRPFAQGAREIRDTGSDEFNPVRPRPHRAARGVAHHRGGQGRDRTGLQRVRRLRERGRAVDPRSRQGQGCALGGAELDAVVPELLSQAYAGIKLKPNIV